jgi:hypothetical protein
MQEFKAILLFLHMLLRSNEYTIVNDGTMRPNSKGSRKVANIRVPAMGMRGNMNMRILMSDYPRLLGSLLSNTWVFQLKSGDVLPVQGFDSSLLVIPCGCFHSRICTTSLRRPDGFVARHLVGWLRKESPFQHTDVIF